MTESEAIKMLEIQKPAYGCKEYKKPLMYAYEMAIKALEEVQQYRAIGTPEELQAAMEKQIAKKPIKSENQVVRYVNTYYCPTCELGITGTNIAKWCYHCGQKLDWSDEE